MRLADSLDLIRNRPFVVASAGILFAVLAEAMGGSYMALLAVERAHMGPIELSVFLTLSAISGIGVTWLFGRMLDRAPGRGPLLLTLIAGVVGYGLCAVVREPWQLMAIAFLLLGLSNAAFALLFGIAKRHLDGTGDTAASSGMAALRMLASLAWAIGPALAAIAVALLSYEGVYGGAALCALVALAIVLAGRLHPVAEPAEHIPMQATLWRRMWPAALALTLFNTAMFMGSNALSIVTIDGLGTATDVGLLFSLCAAVEVVVMGWFVIRPAHLASRAVIAVGFAIFAAYFLATLLIPILPTLYAGQLLRGTAISIVSIIAMLYVQNEMPNQAGGAAALFANTVNAGWLVSGVATGTWAAGFGYWSLMGVCAGLSLAGAGLFLLPLSRSR